MATVTTITYGTPTAMTWTNLSSFASTLLTGTNSTAIDNTSTIAVDAQVGVKVIYGAVIPVGLLWFGITQSTDATNYGNPATGTDSATIALLRAPQFPTNFMPGPGGSLYFPASQIFYATAFDCAATTASQTFYISIPSVASCCGSPNVLPQKWGLFMLNHSGQSTTTSCTATQTSIKYTNT